MNDETPHAIRTTDVAASLASAAAKHYKGHAETYADQFAPGMGGLLPRVRKVMSDYFTQIRQKNPNRTIHLVDFGCANGRYLEMAESLARSGHAVHLYGIDISGDALREFEKGLHCKGYERIQEGDIGENEIQHGQKGPTYSRVRMAENGESGSMTVHLIHNGTHDTPNAIFNNLLDGIRPDMIWSMFGVLSFNAKDYRIGMMNAFMEYCAGPVLFTIPGIQHDNNRNRADNVLQMAELIGQSNGNKAWGNILLQRQMTDFPGRDGRPVPYHFTSVLELKHEMEKAGIKKHQYQIRACNIGDEKALCSKEALNTQHIEIPPGVQDMEASKNLREEELDARARFLMVEAIPEVARGTGYELRRENGNNIGGNGSSSTAR